MSRLFAVTCMFLATLALSPVARAQTNPPAIAQAWIDGWNSKDAEKLVSAFTADGIYEDVPFNIKKKGSAELRELHKFFHGNCSGPGHGVTAAGGAAMTSWIAWRADFPLSRPVAMTEAAAA